MSQDNRNSRSSIPGFSLGVAAVSAAVCLAVEHAQAHDQNRDSVIDKFARWVTDTLFDASSSSLRPRTRPLTRADIDSFPVRHLPREEAVNHREKVCCVVCMEPFEEGDRLMRMPCFHEYHSGCIRDYLKATDAPLCPICRHPVTPS